jgi:hypothetical protein
LCSAVSVASGSRKFVKELFYISNAASEVLDATAEFIEPRLHGIEAAFDRHESLFCLGRSNVVLLRRQAANEVVLLGMLPGAAREVGNVLWIRITCVADEEII